MRLIVVKYNNKKPWLSNCLREAIKKKNKLYYKSIKTKLKSDDIIYKQYRNKLSKLLKAAEKKHYSDCLLRHKHNNKKTWSIIKDILNQNRRNRIQDKFKLSDGSVTTDKQEISDKFNEYFINVGPNLARKIPTQNKSPTDYLTKRETEILLLRPVTHDEITK